MSGLTRVHLHWTAGADGVTELERSHYHYIVGRDGAVTKGRLPPEANRAPIRGDYAAHTLGANSGAIGVALDAMAGAVERPFSAGPCPITEVQLEAMARLVAGLCREWRIGVTRKTVLTHAEVQPTLGIQQRGKWDITWLPGMDKPGDPVKVGDMLRARVIMAMGDLK